MSTSMPAVSDEDLTHHPKHCRCAPCRAERRIDGGRRAENTLAYAGAGQALFAGLMESLVRAGVRLGDGPAEAGIPWVNLAILVICVMPKTVGRATAGRAIDAVSSRFGARSQ